MTSAIVSNISVQVADNIAASSKTDLNAGASSKDFSQVMSTSFAAKANEISTNQNSEVVSNVRVSQTNTKEIKSYTNEDKQAKLSDEKVADTKEQVETFGQEVKEVISKELDVTEEELTEAMETLALTALDLTNNANMAVLVSDLNEIDSVALLADENFANIVTQVGELTEALVEQTGLSVEELSAITNPEEANTETLTLEEADISSDEVIVASTAETTSIASEAVAGQNTSSEISESETVEEVEVTDATEATEITSAKSEETDSSESKDSQANQGNSRESSFSNITANLHEATAEAVAQPVSTTYDVATGEITLSTGETTDVQSIIDQIVEMARTNTSAEITTLELLLNPEGLGKIYMQVSEENGEISAKLYTQNEEVKEALQSQMILLTEQLQATGTKVTAVEVSVATHEFEKNLEEGQQENEQAEQNAENQPRRTRSLNLNSLDELQGLMTEEEELVAKIMRENGNTMDIIA